MSWKGQMLRWWAGANRAGITGGAVAVKAFLAAAAANAAGVQVPVLTLEQAAYVFAFAFAVDFFSYLAANPLPEVEDVERGALERGRNAAFVNPATDEMARSPILPAVLPTTAGNPVSPVSTIS